MLVAVDKVFLVAGVGPRCVRLLYAAARGAIVARYGESYHGTVVQRDGLLDESLAEGAAAYDGAAVVVL